MAILNVYALAHHAGGHEAAIMDYAAQDGVTICTRGALDVLVSDPMLALYPGGTLAAVHDLELEGTPMRVALPGSIAGRQVQ